MLDPESRGIDWIRIVAERRIEEAIEEGKFDNLPGKGRPLVFEDDPSTPVHVRVSNHVLKNAGAVPTWLSMEQEIDAAKAEAEAFRDGMSYIQQSSHEAPPQAEIAAARAEYEKLMRRANDLILRYNVVTPFVHRGPIPFRIKDRLAEWDAAFNASGGAAE